MKTWQFLALVCCWGLPACTQPEPTAGSARPTSTPPVAAPTVASTPQHELVPTSSAASIYDLSISLTDETGARRALDTFRGHPVLITMFYGSCPIACPILTSDLKRIERQIPEPLRSDVRILMVSFDAKRDTPAALAQLKQERGLTSGRWTLASASENDARELAGVLDIKYRQVEGGAFYHSSVITLLDRQGRPQARLEGSGKDAAGLLSALAGPSI